MDKKSLEALNDEQFAEAGKGQAAGRPEVRQG